MTVLVNFPQSTHEQVVRFMSNLAEMVIREPPGNFYLFAQKYFEDLLIKRDGEVDKEYEKLTNCAKFIRNSPEEALNLETIDATKKRRIDFIALYRKMSSNQDNDRLIVGQEERLEEKEMQEEVKMKPQTPFKSELKLYKSLQSSFEAITEDEDEISCQESLQEVFIVNQMIQLYLPSAFADSFEDVIQERHLDEVELIPYRSFEGYSVKFSILAWNDYGVVLSVACGHESEVIIFLLRMPDEDEEFKVPPKAIEYEKKAPKFEVDSEVFRGFLLRFLDSFYPRGNYHQFTFIKIEDPGNSLLTPPDTPALPFQDHNEPPEMENFVFLEKSLELLRMENKTGCFETHQTIRPRSVPAAKVPKHLRQRVKSAK